MVLRNLVEDLVLQSESVDGSIVDLLKGTEAPRCLPFRLI